MPLRCAVVEAARGRSARTMAAAVLGRFDDRSLTWRDPPRTPRRGLSSLTWFRLRTSWTMRRYRPRSRVGWRSAARWALRAGRRGLARQRSWRLRWRVSVAVNRGPMLPTAGGTVLVVANDDPRSWVIALRDYDADPAHVLLTNALNRDAPGHSWRRSLLSIGQSGS